jgi:uncharacterized protein
LDLTPLYKDAKQASFLHSRFFVEGCLLGACACPEIPLPDVWLPWVIKHHHQIESAQQADAIADILFENVKTCLSQMHTETLTLPAYAVYNTQDNATVVDKESDENHALAQWCQGVLMAHSAREKFWQGAWDKMQQQAPNKAPKLAKDLKHCLMMFTTFAEPQKAIQQAEQKGDAEFVNKLPLIAKSLEQTLLTYVAISGELAKYLPNQFETFTQ